LIERLIFDIQAKCEAVLRTTFGENALAEEAALVKAQESSLGYTGDDVPACPETAPFDPEVKFCWVSSHSDIKTWD
jgi:hypothetical protein